MFKMSMFLFGVISFYTCIGKKMCLRLLKLFFWRKLLRLVSEVNFPDQKYFTVAHNIIGNDRHFSL